MNEFETWEQWDSLGRRLGFDRDRVRDAVADLWAESSPAGLGLFKERARHLRYAVWRLARRRRSRLHGFGMMETVTTNESPLRRLEMLDAVETFDHLLDLASTREVKMVRRWWNSNARAASVDVRRFRSRLARVLCSRASATTSAERRP